MPDSQTVTITQSNNLFNLSIGTIVTYTVIGGLIAAVSGAAIGDPNGAFQWSSTAAGQQSEVSYAESQTAPGQEYVVVTGQQRYFPTGGGEVGTATLDFGQAPTPAPAPAPTLAPPADQVAGGESGEESE